MVRAKRTDSLPDTTDQRAVKASGLLTAAEHPVIKWLASMFVACGFGFGVGVWFANRNADEEVEARLRTWEFASPLYEKVPGDIDFVARGLRVGRREGGSTEVHLPNGDHFNLRVSAVRKVATGHEIAFSLIGDMGTNRIISNEMRIPVVRHSLQGPVSVGSHEFFVFIDDVGIDHVVVSVVRRAVPEMGVVKGFLAINAMGPAYIGERPEPVIGTTAAERRAAP